MGGVLNSTVGRVGLGAMTLGGSELWRAGAKKLGMNADDEQGAYATPEDKAKQDYQKFLTDYPGQMGEAEKGVQNSAMTKGLYGEGGLQSQLGDEEKRLASQGYGLQQQDHEAYGQTAGNISRLFGQQDQAATSDLARRGLASADSGTAMAQYAGLAGNKNEMLAQAQTQIAQKRMADTQSRLQATRQQMQSLGMQGSQLADSRYNTKGAALGQNVAMEGQLNNENRQTLMDQQAAVKKGLFSTIGQGIQSGIGSVAQAAPSLALGAATGGGSLIAQGAMSGQQQPQGMSASDYGSSGLSQNNQYNKSGYSLFGR
jgi:hypothetical protein